MPAAERSNARTSKTSQGPVGTYRPAAQRRAAAICSSLRTPPRSQARPARRASSASRSCPSRTSSLLVNRARPWRPPVSPTSVLPSCVLGAEPLGCRPEDRAPPSVPTAGQRSRDRRSPSPIKRATAPKPSRARHAAPPGNAQPPEVANPFGVPTAAEQPHASPDRRVRGHSPVVSWLDVVGARSWITSSPGSDA